MARVELLPGMYDDLQRIVDHLERYEAEHVPVRVGEIVSAFDVLSGNPLIGRPASDDLRELVIGRAEHGYIALYRYLSPADLVVILAIRAQREGGYASDE